MNCRILLSARLALFFLLLSPLNMAFAQDQLALEGDISVWWNLYEENPNGILQAGSKDPAATSASGFNLKQGRLILDYLESDSHLSARLQLRLEERLALLDAYGQWAPLELVQVAVGQMKIPSTYEVLAPDNQLDFITRATLSKNIGDWALSRTPYYGSLYGNRSDNRDTGLALKGNLKFLDQPRFFNYFLMVSNGLGANLNIGATESKEFITANELGDYFYGGRLEIAPWSMLKLGGHYSLNRHDNMLYNDGKTVLDLDRNAYSFDLRLSPLPYLHLTALYGAGAVEDDYFHTEQSNLDYHGWEVKILGGLWQERLQLGLRYDSYSASATGDAHDTTENTWTAGLNWTPLKGGRLQFNYMDKTIDYPAETDRHIQMVFLNFQYQLRADLL
jgi:hypothetical protein